MLDLSTVAKLKAFWTEQRAIPRTDEEKNTILFSAFLSLVEAQEVKITKLEGAVVLLAKTLKEAMADDAPKAVVTTDAPKQPAAGEPEMGRGGPAIPEDQLPFKTRPDAAPGSAVGTGEGQNTSQVVTVTPNNVAPPPAPNGSRVTNVMPNVKPAQPANGTEPAKAP